MQLQHEAEEILAGGIAHELGGVRIEVAHLATALARWRGEEHLGRIAAVGFDGEHRDFFAGRGFDALDQFGGRQDAGNLLLDLQHGRVQHAQDFILKRYRCPGDAHQGQDQPGTDAEKPVQLEQGFLQHVARLVRSKSVITARIMPWVVEKHSFLRTKAPLMR